MTDHQHWPHANVCIFPTIEELSHAAAERTVKIVNEAFDRRGRCSLALAGGSTPATLYRLLASSPFRYAAPWQKVHYFWSDERCVPPDHPESNYLLARTTMLCSLEIPESQIHRMPGEEDPPRAAEMVEKKIRDVLEITHGFFPRIDLVLLGMGEDGHTASLFANAPDLHESERWAIASVKPGGWRRITLSLPAINHAHHIMFLVAGSGKAHMLKRALGDPTPEVPAGLVRAVEGELHWMVDQAAASDIT